MNKLSLDRELRAGDVLRIPEQELTEYKTHLATRSSSGDEPLDVFVSDWDDWVGWNQYRPERNIFSRPYIFSLIEFYPENNRWLFGGIFRVLERHEERYEVELADIYRPLIGRLLLTFERSFRARALKLEKYYDQFAVARVMEKVYEGQAFPGFHDIEVTFSRLEEIVGSGRRDWKAALASVKGVYLITDMSNGRPYVGSAYGAGGVWARWNSYVRSGHGGDQELMTVIADQGKQYAENHFMFSLLEHHPMHKEKGELLDRESYWKRVLQSRKHGYNSN